MVWTVSIFFGGHLSFVSLSHQQIWGSSVLSDMYWGLFPERKCSRDLKLITRLYLVHDVNRSLSYVRYVVSSQGQLFNWFHNGILIPITVVHLICVKLVRHEITEDTIHFTLECGLGGGGGICKTGLHISIMYRLIQIDPNAFNLKDKKSGTRSLAFTPVKLHNRQGVCKLFWPGGQNQGCRFNESGEQL
jgi:hypothetical protein